MEYFIISALVALGAMGVSYTTWEGELLHNITNKMGIVGKMLQCPICLAGWAGFVTGVAIYGVIGLVIGLIAMGLNVVLTTFMYKD